MTVLYPGHHFEDLKHMTPEAVFAKYKVTPAQYPDLAALRGETADNIPGVPGVGDGFAAKWINQYGSLEGICEHADEIGSKKGESLRENLDQVKLNRKVNALVRDIDLGVTEDDLTFGHFDAAKIDELFTSLEFGSRTKTRILKTFNGGEAPKLEQNAKAEAGKERSAIEVSDVQYAGDADTLNTWVEQNLPKPDASGASVNDESDDAGTQFTIDHSMQCNGIIERSWVINAAGNAKPGKVKANADHTAIRRQRADHRDSRSRFGGRYGQANGCRHGRCRLTPQRMRRGCESRGCGTRSTSSSRSTHPPWSCMATRNSFTYLHPSASTCPSRCSTPNSPATWCSPTSTRIRSNRPPRVSSTSMWRRRPRRRRRDCSTWTMVPTRMPTAIRLRHCCRHPAIIAELARALAPQIDQREQFGLLQRMELPVSHVLYGMESQGAKVDMQRLTAMRDTFAADARQAQEIAWDYAGTTVNLQSPKQLGKVLFEDMGLKPTKRTKTGGYTTNADALQKLYFTYADDERASGFLGALLRHRETNKLKQIVATLIDATNPADERIHTTFEQTVAATGRLSSVNPNLQNIPNRNAAGREDPLGVRAR